MPIGTATPAGMNPANKPQRGGLNSGPAKSLAPTSGKETEAFMKARNMKRRDTTSKGVKS